MRKEHTVCFLLGYVFKKLTVLLALEVSTKVKLFNHVIYLDSEADSNMRSFASVILPSVIMVEYKLQ